jgi:hypothetical protein
MSERACRRCGAPTWSGKSPYCRDHRPPPEVRARWAQKTREARGYGAAHRTLRAQVARQVAAGAARCARCGLPIVPGSAWDLDHGADRSGYLGPSHSKCNRVEGARSGAAVTNAARRRNVHYRNSWSRVWSWPIPPDTYVDPEVIEEYLRDSADKGEGSPRGGSDREGLVIVTPGGAP